MASTNDTDGNIMTGGITNGTFWVAGFDPSLPVPHWHQNMELATICVCNSLTLIVIISRLWYRWIKLKHFRGDDAWIAVAGFFLLPYWASQIGTNVYGSGLHVENVTENDLRMHWHFSTGWCGYYIVASCIKISVCVCFLEILPRHVERLRYSVYGLCVLIAALSLTMTFAWLFGATPVLSNFLWSVEPEYSVNYDYFRWLWIGLSIPIDVVLLIIPARILRKVQLRQHERRILKLVFSATLLGTIACIIGIYGIYDDRTATQTDGNYHDTPFIMMNDIEIFMYTVGASLPVLSRYLLKKAAPRINRSSKLTGFSTLGRRFPHFFISSSHQSTLTYNDNSNIKQLHSYVRDAPQNPLSQLRSAFDDMPPPPDTLLRKSRNDLERGEKGGMVEASRESSENEY